MKILENIALAPYTTFQVGGKARYFCAVKDVEELEGALAFARAQSLPFFILGGGSNIVIADGGFAGLVIKMELRGATHEMAGKSVMVTAWAGESWDDLVAKTVEWGAWGMENLSLIPGTVGASPVQNIGAYGVEVMDVIESVRVIDGATGQEHVMSNAECGFSYRDSIFKKPQSKSLVIVSVTFKLGPNGAPNLTYKDLHERFAGKPVPTQLEVRDAVIAIRSGKFPDLSQIGTAGSFWKNPILSKEIYDALKQEYPEMPSFPVDENRVKVPLAWILDKVCGLKGYSKGNVGLFEKQPLVLVAKIGSTAREIMALEEEVRMLVKQKTALDIEREVGFLG